MQIRSLLDQLLAHLAVGFAAFQVDLDRAVAELTVIALSVVRLVLAQLSQLFPRRVKLLPDRGVPLFLKEGG